ncbi:hypothetical protein MY11210_008547 [Beauveria gryllotalpidicola]
MPETSAAVSDVAVASFLLMHLSRESSMPAGSTLGAAPAAHRQGRLETYLCETVSATEFEDGVALVGSFIYRAELSKIIHIMIADLFENRRGDSDPVVVAAKSHVSLTKLPGTVHWNQWSVSKVPPSVLHLHGGGGEGGDKDIEALITDEILSAQLQTDD